MTRFLWPAIFALLSGSAPSWASDSNFSFMGLDEVHMSGAGIAHLGSPGSVINNPANLGFSPVVDRYYTLLSIVSNRSQDYEIDSTFFLVPALAERTFALAGGVAAVYVGSMEINFQSMFLDEGLVGESFVRAQIIRGGLAWGTQRDQYSWGGSVFGISNNSSSTFVNSDADSLNSGRSSASEISLGVNLGVARKTPWGGWGVKFLPPVQPVRRRNQFESKFVATTGDVLSFRDYTQQSRARRPSEIGAGIKLKLSERRFFLMDASSVSDDYARRSSDYWAFRLGYADEVQKEIGLLAGAMIIPPSTAHEDGMTPDQLGASLGFKIRAKKSYSTLGLSYRQDFKGADRTIASNFCSEFEI